jgi:ribonuclease R
VHDLATQHGLILTHGKAALSEAAAATLDLDGLVDMRDVPFVTVDSASTRDLDQALHVARAGSGWRVRYALADPAWFVRPGTALWDEALARGASYYLPEYAVPMLPRSLSEGLISLGEGVDRRAMVMDIRLEADGRVRRTEIVRASVRSRAKLSFEEVQAHLEGVTIERIDDAIRRSLDALEAVGDLRVRLNEQREVVRFRRRDGRVPVELHNEQLSLLCNIEGARYLQRARADEGIHPIYRVHPAPPAARLDRFRRMAAAIGRPWSLEQALAVYLAALPEDRVAQAIHRQAIMLNYRSTFEVEAASHFGVGAEVYARFSAPMREIVGIFLHKETWERIEGTGQVDPAGDEVLRHQVLKAANRSKELQRKLDKDAALRSIDEFLERDRGPHRGTVVGLTARRAYVSLDDPAIDLKVDLSDLKARCDDDGTKLSGGCRLSLGDEVLVSVRGRAKGRPWWNLGLESVRQTGG